jgi:hypothetical protein
VVSQEYLMAQHERWQLRGTAPVAYERYLVPTLFTLWAVDLLTRVALPPGARLLDLACGTGIVARLAAPRSERRNVSTGMDRNAAMLEVPRHRLLRGVPPCSGWLAMPRPYPLRRRRLIRCSASRACSFFRVQTPRLVPCGGGVGRRPLWGSLLAGFPRQ